MILKCFKQNKLQACHKYFVITLNDGTCLKKQNLNPEDELLVWYGQVKNILDYYAWNESWRWHILFGSCWFSLTLQENVHMCTRSHRANTSCQKLSRLWGRPGKWRNTKKETLAPNNMCLGQNKKLVTSKRASLYFSVFF